MEAKRKPVSFVMTCRDFFGMKEGQSIGAFASEIKTVSPDPALYAFFKSGLEQNGYVIQDRAAA